MRRGDSRQAGMRGGVRARRDERLEGFCRWLTCLENKTVGL
jgi:hypothetical protein